MFESFEDLSHETRGILVFLAGTMISIVLITLIIFSPFPPDITATIGTITSIIFFGSFAYFIIYSIYSNWSFPDVTREEWILYLGIFFIFVMIFAWFSLTDVLRVDVRGMLFK